MQEFVKDLLGAVSQIALEDSGLGSRVEDELARLGADLDDLPLLHDHHALAVVHGDDGAVGNHIVAAVRVAAALACALLPLGSQDILTEAVAVEELFPLVSQHATCGAGHSFDESHK